MSSVFYVHIISGWHIINIHAPTQIQGTLLHEINDTSRCTNHHYCTRTRPTTTTTASLQSSPLRVLINTTIECYAADTRVGRSEDGSEGVVRLDGEFARGSEYDRSYHRRR